MPFISFEGIDGSGKSTQASYLAATLRAMGADVITTKEPDGGPLGSEVRCMLVRARQQPLDVMEEMLLVSAARIGHIKNVITPALDQKKWVISDRFFDSTYAFQFFGTGMSKELFDIVSNEVVGNTIPDLTFILDMDPTVALDRRTKRTETLADPAEHRRDFGRIRDGLLDAAKQSPIRCNVINGNASPRSVADEIVSIIKRRGLLDNLPRESPQPLT